MIQVKSKDGLSVRCEIRTFEYNGVFMGVRSISCTYESPEVINFDIGDYVEYRGEKFLLDYNPSDSKNAEVRRAGNAIKYSLVFHPESAVELENCDFCDYVLYDNLLHYSSSPKFSFIGTANDLADRIKANLDRLYPGKWTIEIDSSVITEDKNIEIENTSCWNAVVLFNKEFGLNFTVINRKVKVGFSSNIVKHTFNYGSGNGLYKIERNVNSDEAVITRLKAFGGERNLPEGYNKLSTDIVPKKNLMLPGYKETGIDYIESPNVSIYGIRPQAIVFDDIYPSIEGVEVEGLGRIDEIVSADKITEDTESSNTFKIRIKDIGFNINDYLVSGQTATISIKNGSLIRYEFEIVEVKKLDTGGYELTLNKSQRDNWTVPNKDQNLSAGNRFVLLNIRMPEKYVAYAEDKLLKRAKEYLARYDHVTYTYDIGVDEIFMARNVSLHENIREGDKLPFYDANLSIDSETIIQALVITEGGNVPTYKITLSDQPTAGTIDKIWDAINNIKNQGTVSSPITTGGGGISQDELNRKYLRKDVPDFKNGTLSLNDSIKSSIFIDDWDGKGWEIPSTGAATLDSLRVRSDILVGNSMSSPSFASGFAGWGVEIDIPTATAEMDNLFVRKTFTAYEIVYSQIYGLGGSQIVSDLNKIARVEVLSDRYRCYMDDMDGLMLMNLRKGDGVRIQTRTGTTSIKYLMGRCIGVDSDYFDIAIPLLEGTGQPEAGDFAMRWGNDEDTDRQGLIYLTTADSGAPFIDVYDGITGVSTEGKLKARLGHLTGIRTQRGDQLSGYGAYLNGIYIENSIMILQNGDTIDQTFIAMNGKFESLIDGIRNDISAEGGNILVNSSFSQNTNYWTAANNVHFINVGGEYLWMDGSFYVEKDQVADIYNDKGQNVLRIRNTYILQQNGIMNIPEHTEGEEKTYSFSLFCKVLRAGSCGFGIPGTDLYHEEQLPVSDSYQKISKVGKWDGTGNFELRFTGEILIYGVGLFSDEIADAIIKLQTDFQQTEEYIKLLATKDYVDSETEQVYIHYDSQLQITAEQMSGISTKVDNINNTIESSGWITEAQGTTLFAKKDMENGSSIVNAINVGTSGILIQANRVNLNGAVSFSMLSDYNTVNNRISSAQNTANNAAYDALDAWNKAVSAASSASTANTNATNAQKAADEAAKKAVEALTQAGAIPSWAKESSVIEAMKSSGFILGGYLNVQYATINEIQAVKGTVGGWYIGNSSLSNSSNGQGSGTISGASFDMYSTTYPGTNFLHMNPAASTILAIRADNKTGLSISSSNVTGTCLSLSAQTGSAAVHAAGGASWYQRSGETWNMPGVLGVAYYMNSGTSGSMTKVWGEGIVWGRCTRNGTGNYTVAFTRNSNTDIDYMPIIGGYNNFYGSFCITNKTSSTSFTFQAVATNGDAHDAQFYIVMVGRNRLT